MNTINGQKSSGLTLQDLHAIRKFEAFGCEDVEVYRESLSRKNLAELYTIAMKHNVKPGSDRMKLVRRLVDSFIAAKREYNFAQAKK